MDFSRTPALLSTFMLMLFLPLLGSSQVYKWTDEDGKVHFGDRPPGDGQAQEMDMPSSPTQSQVNTADQEFRNTLESRRQRDQRSDEYDQVNGQVRSEDYLKSERFTQCVEAKQQAHLLEHAVRVFKLGSDWSRSYLTDDAERAAEISRMNDLQTDNCEPDKDPHGEERKQMNRLNLGLDIRCVNAADKHRTLSASELLSDDEELKKYEDYLASDCPQVNYHDYWIADWIRMN